MGKANTIQLRTQDGERPDIYKPTDKECLTCKYYHTYYECMSTPNCEYPVFQCDLIRGHAKTTDPKCKLHAGPPMDL